MDLVQFEPNQYIIEQGYDADCLYYILSGFCKILKVVDGEPFLIGARETGDLLGDLELMNECKSETNAITVNKITACVIPCYIFKV